MRVKTNEITITLDYQEAFYLVEALYGFELKHYKNKQKPYLPKLLLEIQRACSIEMDETITNFCKKALEE